MKNKKRIFRSLQWGVVLVIFFFMGKMVWDNWAQVKGVALSVKPVSFFLATIVFTWSYFIQVWAWYLITVKLGIQLSLSETLTAWFYSQMGKYLPGKVWLLLGRFYLYESKGKSKTLVSTGLYFEMVTIIVAGGIIFLFSLLLFNPPFQFFSGEQMGWIIFLILIPLPFLHPQLLQKLMNWVLIRLKRETVTLHLSYLDILRIVLIGIFAWLVGGIGFYLFVDSIYPIPSRHFLFLTGTLAFSSTLGLIAVFAPAGLGVREGAFAYLLTSLVSAPIAVLLSVATRLWMTFIEIGLIGVIYWLNHFRKR